MRAFVFTDESLASDAGRFVWLEIDTEKAKNAAVRKRLGIPALPTFFILDPVDEHVALRWVGGATAAEMKKILADGRAAVAHAHVSPSTPPSGAAEALARADRLYGAGDFAAAAAAYGEAMAAAPEDWPPYVRVVESRLFALQSIDSNEVAAHLARDAYPRLRHTTAAAAVAGSGLDAATALPATHPQRAALIQAMEAASREVVADSTLAVPADDRSAVYISLLEARKDAGDEAGAKQVATAWSAFLDREAARAKTPDAR